MALREDGRQLTPQFCFNQAALKEFLQISRSSIDDTISQHLNALVTPSRSGLGSSRSVPSPSSPRSLSRQAINSNSCDEFKSRLLFPAWHSRSQVLAYCSSVATSPDPDDPNHDLREIEDARARERLIDERLDPYSGRYRPRELRTELLATTIRNERAVEEIVRARSWGVVQERCGREGLSAVEALDQWRSTR